MPRHQKANGFENPRKSVLDESNPLSYLPDGRNSQADYYRLENRQKQLAMISNLSQSERNYIMGKADATQAEISGAIQQLHETDLVELKALVYLQKLPDSSPELYTLKSWCGCETREQIAKYIAQKEMKKLVISQVTRIAGGDALSALYGQTIVKGANAFQGLYGQAPAGGLFGGAPAQQAPPG